MTETLSPNCYTETVFQCAACGCLDVSTRAHTTTCSARCRGWLRRHPEHIASLLADCKTFRVTLALVLRARAMQRLCPHLASGITAGTVELADTRKEVRTEFYRRVFAAAGIAEVVP